MELKASRLSSRAADPLIGPTENRLAPIRHHWLHAWPPPGDAVEQRESGEMATNLEPLEEAGLSVHPIHQ